MLGEVCNLSLMHQWRLLVPLPLACSRTLKLSAACSVPDLIKLGARLSEPCHANGLIDTANLDHRPRPEIGY